MVIYHLKIQRKLFREWFDEFSRLVKDRKYDKLEYDKWRPLHLWSKSDGGWDVFEINRECPDLIYIVPKNDNKLSPNGIKLNPYDHSFGGYLGNKMTNYLNNTNYAETAACSAIKADKASLTTAIDYSYSDSTTTINNSYGYGTTTPWTVDLNVSDLRINGDSLDDHVTNLINKYCEENEKENKKDMKFGNFDFGPVNSEVHMSMYGMAIKNASGTYVSYDVANKRLMDVDIINFEGANKFMYKMPAAMKDIAVGDIVVHARKPMFVTEITSEGKLVVIDPTAGEEKTIMLAHSPFGFNFVTKVVSLLNFGGADKDNPFGNMLPFILLNDSNSKDNTALMMAMMCGHTDMMKNPMLVYALMGDHKNNDMLPFLLMCGFGAQPSGCSGNCHCHDNK